MKKQLELAFCSNTSAFHHPSMMTSVEPIGFNNPPPSLGRGFHHGIPQPRQARAVIPRQSPNFNFIPSTLPTANTSPIPASGTFESPRDVYFQYLQT